MTTTAAPARRLPVWAKVLIGTALALVALLAAGLLWLVSVMSGGLDDLFGSAPSEDDPEVVAAGERSAAALEEQGDRLVGAVAGPALGAPTGLAVGAGSACERGQHNWKIDDDYDLACSRAQVAVVAGGDLAGFRDGALALHERLLADGWRPRSETDGLPERSSIAWVVGDYWDRRASFTDPDYTPDDLPTADYVREDTGLTVHWLTSAGGRVSAYPVSDLALADPRGGAVPAERAGQLVPPGAYAAVLVLRQEYFRE